MTRKPPDLTLAQLRRLVLLARRGVWADSMQERELAHFNALVARGYATLEECHSGYDSPYTGHSWLRYRITAAGELAARPYR
jgi:hypothetical protein